MTRVNSWFRRSVSSNSDYASVASDEMVATGCRTWPLWQLILFWLAITILTILVIFILLIWVVFPLVFMNTYSLQRFFVFWNVEDIKNPEYNNPEKYKVHGAVNFYFDSTDMDGHSRVRLGAWLVTPDKDMNSTVITNHSIETATELLSKTDMPVVLLMHGVLCTRIKMNYKAVRTAFLTIAPDHRGYADSESEPSEEAIVHDTIQIYKWIRNHTKNDIYIWGHSLGTALTLHTVRKLLKENIVPMGVIIESAYTTLREEIPETEIGKIFNWLPYFNACVLDPLDENGFHFYSTDNIKHVNCPLLMMHSQDDTVIPVKLGRKLANVAKTQRNLQEQGNVTYYEFPARLKYNHVGIPEDKDLPGYLSKFKNECREQNKMRN